MDRWRLIIWSGKVSWAWDAHNEVQARELCTDFLRKGIGERMKSGVLKIHPPHTFHKISIRKVKAKA